MIRALAAGAVLALAVVACGGTPVDRADPSASMHVLRTQQPATPATSATPAASTPVETAVPSHGDATNPTEEDEGLLAVLPEEVGGSQVALEHQAFTDAASDPAFEAGIETAAFFVAPGEADIVSGLVARPREGVYSDAWFVDWRETYDEGACAAAGGIAGHAEAQIGGRPVVITTCAGDMRVYHAWVQSQGVVVSLISLGEGRWGEKVMSTLRP